MLSRLVAALKNLFADPPGLCFGGIVVPDTYGEGAFMLVGVPGTGKGVVFDAFLRQVLPPVRSAARSDRALVYDPKSEYVSKFQKLGLYDPVSAAEPGSGFDAGKHSTCVVITNPLDARGYAWDIARDFDHLLDGEQLAEIFTSGVGQKSDRTEFFVSTSKQLFAAVFRALHRLNPHVKGVPGSGWTLRDFILAFESREDLAALLDRHDDTRAVWREYLGEEISRTDTGPSVYASLRTYLAKLTAVAAVWHATKAEHPERTFAFRDWVDGRSVVILGKVARHQEHVQLANRLMFHKASLELLGHETKRNALRNTWVVLDELPELGYLSQLQNLMAVGRDWGVRVVFAFQDHSQLVKCFGPDDARSLTSLAHTFGALNCAIETAEWVSKMFGYYRDERGEKREVVPPEDIAGLPAKPQESGVVGWYYSKRLDEQRAQRHVLRWQEAKKCLLHTDPKQDRRGRTDEADFVLEEWRPEERKTLGLDRPAGPGRLVTIGGWPERILRRRVDAAGRRAAAVAGGPRKPRSVPFQGEVLNFSCTDDELADFMSPDTLHALWWRLQPDEFRDRWVESSHGMNEAEIEELKYEMYASREAERRAGVKPAKPRPRRDKLD